MPEIGYWKYVRFNDDEKQYWGTDDDIVQVFDSIDDRLEFRMGKDIRFEDDAGNLILTIEKATRTLSAFKMTGNLEIEKSTPQLIIDATTGNSIITFESAGTGYCQLFYEPGTDKLHVRDQDGAVNVFSILVSTGDITKMGKFTQNVEIEKTYPALRLDDSGTTGGLIEWAQGGANKARLWLSDDGSKLFIYDVEAGATRIRFDRTTGDITNVGHIKPTGAGTKNLGDATNYWNDVSYKTLTDRGCLGYFDKGVELQDGSIVSDVEALKAIQVHPTLKTVYGVPRFNYKTLPKAVYRAPDGEKLNERKKRLKKELEKAESEEEKLRIKNEIKRVDTWIAERGTTGLAGDDGAEITALISIMIGAIRELSAEIEQLKLT